MHLLLWFLGYRQKTQQLNLTDKHFRFMMQETTQGQHVSSCAETKREIKNQDAGHEGNIFFLVLVNTQGNADVRVSDGCKH